MNPNSPRVMSSDNGCRSVAADVACDEPDFVSWNQAASPQAIEHFMELAFDVLEPHTVTLYLQRSDNPVFELHMRWPLTAPARPVSSDEIGLVAAVKQSMDVVAASNLPMGSHISPSTSTDITKGSSLVKLLSQIRGRWSKVLHRLGSSLRNLTSTQVLPPSIQSKEPGNLDFNTQLQHAAGAPVIVGEQLFGVLIVDRATLTMFTTRELRMLQCLATQLGRTLQADQWLKSLSREQLQKNYLYQASRELATARTVQQVGRVAVQMVQQITNMEFGALVVQADSSAPSLQIAAVNWKDRSPMVAGWIGKVCSQDSLVTHAVDSARLEDSEAMLQAPLFSPDATLELAALRLMPLSWKSTNVGALIVGHTTHRQLTDEQLNTLHTMADQTAVAISNALSFERLERMATTDGLTGLTNRRHFMDLFAVHVARAERHGRQLSLIMCDIDHFKRVNDTHGHPVGDIVLQHVAHILQRMTRCTDVVARYGDEEFVILMEETGSQGALQMAERIRQVVEAETVDGRGVQVRCTLSLGVATFPQDATHQNDLIECADQALYRAKHGGRNQTVVSGGSWAAGRISPEGGL